MAGESRNNIYFGNWSKDHKKEYYKNKTVENRAKRLEMFNVNNYYGESTCNIIALAMRKAISHTETVARRDHIKADRIERVNLFINSLRTQFNYYYNQINSFIAKEVLSELYNKEIWHDVGVLNLNFTFNSKLLGGRETVIYWLDLAKKIPCNDYAKIEMDLEELEYAIKNCQQVCCDVKKINQEAEPLTENLCEIFE